MQGLNLYDFSARYYESAIGRFTIVDPLAEKYYSISPYAYCNNNPIKRIDPTGMWYGDFYDMDANRIGTDGINDGKQYIVLDNSQAKQVAATDKAGGTTSRSSVSSAVEPLSTDVIKASEIAFNYTETTGYESGFVAATDGSASSVLSQQQPGEVRLSAGYSQINGTNIRGTQVKFSSFDAHVHPKDIVRNPDGTYTASAPTPSGNVTDLPGASGDFGYRKLGESQGVTTSTPSMVLGWNTTNVTPTSADQTRVVTFYNGNGIVGQANWSSFVKVVNKIR